MDRFKYRKWYLSENWQNNAFHMIIHCAKQQKRTREGQMVIHPLIVKGKAFRINDRELCVGYRSASNHTIFRPIFSHKRQRILDNVHENIRCPTVFWYNTDKPYHVCTCKVKELQLDCVRVIKCATVFWYNTVERYYLDMCKVKKLPLDCVHHIIRFIY